MLYSCREHGESNCELNLRTLAEEKMNPKKKTRILKMIMSSLEVEGVSLSPHLQLLKEERVTILVKKSVNTSIVRISFILSGIRKSPNCRLLKS